MSLFGNAIHVIWKDDTPDPDEILYKRSIDIGSSFFETKTFPSITYHEFAIAFFRISNLCLCFCRRMVG
jgi:hypothetical protein